MPSGPHHVITKWANRPMVVSNPVNANGRN